MKKIFALAFMVMAFVSAFSQADSTKPGFGTDRKYFGYKISTVERNGIPLDSMRIFRIGLDTFRMQYPGMWLVSHGGIYGNGSDMSAKTALAFSRSYVTAIGFKNDSSATYTFSSSLTIPAGKMVYFDKSVKFAGTGAINFNNQLLDGPIDHALFATTLNITGIRTNYGFIPTAWFGAKGDGIYDNGTTFAKTQTATYNRKEQPVFVGPAGTYLITSQFNQTASFIGSGLDAVIKYNPVTATTGATAWVINDDSISFKQLSIDVSGKAYRCITVADNMVDVEIDHFSLTGAEQVGSELSNVSGVFFGRGMDRLRITNFKIVGLNAKNNGVVRGIRGAGNGTGPKDVKIYWGFIDSIRNNGVSTASLWDCDDIVIQDYTDSLRMEIAFITSNNISKRSVKIQASGIKVHDIDVSSKRYLTGSRSYAAVSVYGNACDVYEIRVHGGVYEQMIDISSGAFTYSRNQIHHNKLLGTVTALGGNDGIRLYGTNVMYNTIEYNDIENVRVGIRLDGNSWYTRVEHNNINNCSDNGISTLVTSNVYPNVWHQSPSIVHNTIKKATAFSMYMYRIRGGIIADNQSDSLINMFYYTALDSVIGTNIHDNINNFTGGKSINQGAYADLPAISNSAACLGTMYKIIDSAAFWMKTTAGWVKTSGSSGGGGGLSSAQVKNMIDTTLANQKSTYFINGGKSVADSQLVKKTDSSNLMKSIRVVGANAKIVFARTGGDSANIYTATIQEANFSGILQSAITGLAASFSAKQDLLSSGVNIKTINGSSLLGSGNLVISGGGSGTVNSGTINRLTYYAATGTVVSELAAITANRVLLSDANGLPVASSVTNTTLGYLDATSSIQTQLNAKQATLVNTTNIKSINGNSLLGSGDLSLPVSTVSTYTPTVSSSSNVSSYTASTCNYEVTGKLVKVWGEIKFTMNNTSLSTRAVFNVPSGLGTVQTGTFRGTVSYRNGSAFMSESSSAVQLDFGRTSGGFVWTDDTVQFSYTFWLQ